MLPSQTQRMAEPRPVVIVDYNPDWPLEFASLCQVIGSALGELAIAIEHIGSTSVPGLPAKPIIDLDVVIASRELLPQVIQRLAGLGYVHEGDKGVPGREAFTCDVMTPQDGSGRRWPEHHMYVCCQDSDELAHHLVFRDYLRAYPQVASAYAQLKRQLSERYRNDREAYTEGKTAFVEGVLRKAMRE